MAGTVRAIATGLIAIVTIAAFAASADAWYGHRGRSYRGSRGYNRYGARNAALQRASASLNIARSRLYLAQTNAARELTRARQQAANSPALVTAKSEYSEANRESLTARSAAVARLKETNPEFRDLLAKCQSLRQQIETLAKSNDASGKMQSLQSELRGLARKTILMEDQAVNADPKLQESDTRKAGTHAKAQLAQAEARSSVINDPQVKAAQTQLALAQAQAQQASLRYSMALVAASNTGYGGRSYYRPRVGYRGYRSNVGGSYHSHAHHSGHRRSGYTHFAVRHHR